MDSHSLCFFPHAVGSDGPSQHYSGTVRIDGKLHRPKKGAETNSMASRRPGSRRPPAKGEGGGGGGVSGQIIKNRSVGCHVHSQNFTPKVILATVKGKTTQRT